MGNLSTTVKVDRRNQIAIPAEVRDKLGIKAGDNLIVSVVRGEVILIPEPESWVEYSRGLGAEIWEGIDPVEYVREVRGVCPE
jgi:AbrB family looped-hinge helix DNA binding protein